MRRVLRVNLSSGVLRQEDIPSKVAESFVGGRGFGARYLYDEIRPGIDPLGRENKLLFVTGPLAGTKAQSLSRWMAVTKGPLTGTFTRSVSGGDLGAWLKWAGCELIIFEGKAAKPVYLHIKDGKYQIRDAGAVWGKTTSETEAQLTEIHGPKVRVACIGPAGEKLVRFAGIFSAGRSASRGGTGAVMASKNLKAVAIEADRREDLANPEEFNKLVQEQVSNYRSKLGFKEFRAHGTVIGVDLFHSMGTYPVRNYRFGELQGWENLSYRKYSRITERHLGCYSCMLKCGKLRRVPSGPYAGVSSLGPQYETVWAFSGPTGCTDLGATVLANHLCCELGLDAVSTGNVVGFAYELFEKGIFTAKDTGGMSLNYGDHQAMIKLVEQIGRREGVGNILAEGVKRASTSIGRGAEEYAMHVKGLEMPGYDPRARKTEGMNYALANIGANHCYGYAGQEIGNPRPRLVDPVSDEGKGDIIKFNHDEMAALELANCCMFPSHNIEFFGVELLAKMLAAALGIAKFGSADYLWNVGEKVYNLERCFNIREGFSRKDDALPKRIYEERLRGGIHDGQIVRKPDTILDEYYSARGWDGNGIPTQQTLSRLGLKEVDKDIARFRT